MLVTLTRAAWKSLVAQAAGHEREGGGLLIGRRTRYGNLQVHHATGLTHIEASDGNIRYGPDEVAKARTAAHEVFRPLEPVGEWHSHPWPARDIMAIANQITDDWDNPASDVCMMMDGEVELIASTYPHSGKRLKNSEWRVGTRIDGRVVRVEGWLRVREGKVQACTIRVRG